MKALSKEHILALIENNFKDGETILQNDRRLELMWEQFGDDYFIGDNHWVRADDGKIL